MKSPMNVSWAFVIMVGLLSAAVLPEAAAQTRKQKPEELAGRADVIAVGKVAQIRSEWTPGKERIVTKVVLSVDEYLKGTGEGASVTISVPGGEVDGIGEIYTHMPTFKTDEDVIVFAERGKGDALRITGGSDGKILLKVLEEDGHVVASGNQTKEMVVRRIKQALKTGGDAQ